MWPFRRTPELLEQQRKQLEHDRAGAAAARLGAEEEQTFGGPAGSRDDRSASVTGGADGENPGQGFFEGLEPPPGVRPIKSWSGSISGSGSNVRVHVKSQTQAENSPRETSFSGTPGQLLALAGRHLVRSLLPKRDNRQ